MLNRAKQQLPCFHAFWYISLPLLPRLQREMFVTAHMHKTKDSVFLFGFSVSLFLDTVVLIIQLRQNPSKCNNLNKYSHEVSNSVNWLLKWRFRCHRYHYYHRKHPSTVLQSRHPDTNFPSNPLSRWLFSASRIPPCILGWFTNREGTSFDDR